MLQHVSWSIVSFVLYKISYFAEYHPAGFNIYDRSPGERCGRSNKSICTTVFNCPTATKKLKAGLPHGLEKCGYQGVNEVVCCPDLQSKTAAGNKSLSI